MTLNATQNMSFISCGDVLNILANYPDMPLVFNPWKDVDKWDTYPAAAKRRVERLRLHFDRKDVKLVLVGEAPGYQGCHFSGIPFTSERLLLEGEVPGVPMVERISCREKPWSEPSATVVWRMLKEVKLAEHTVLWNAFPFHPFQTRSVYSNRKPTWTEISRTCHITRLVLGMYEDARVLCVGRVAQQLLLAMMGVPYPYLRHPANGGVPLFEQQLRNFVSREI